MIAYKTKFLVAAAITALAFSSIGCRKGNFSEKPKSRKSIVTSDTILSGMSEVLLPPESFEISAILPPGQCPGHYDIKLSDIAKIKRADLIISFPGMPFMNQTEIDTGKHLVIDTNGHNWMTPPFYIAGIGILASKLIDRFPEQRQKISIRKEHAIREVQEKISSLRARLQQAKVSQKPVIASSMLKEPLEWMGFRVVGEYGRPESISAREIIKLARAGRDKGVVMVVDNLQSGPEAGKGIAEAFNRPHAVFSNFPSEYGYIATLSENVAAALAAAGMK